MNFDEAGLTQTDKNSASREFKEAGRPKGGSQSHALNL